MFFPVALKRSGFLSNVNNGGFFVLFVFFFPISWVLIRHSGYLKPSWLSQILLLFPIVTALGGRLLAIRVKPPRVFPADKIQRCERCECQSKLIRGRGWMSRAFLTHGSFWKGDVGFFS